MAASRHTNRHTTMPDKFDPYREALVLEEQTVWPEEYQDWDLPRRRDLEQKLHADPESAANLEYERLHSGFCRVITVTPDDVSRLAS